MGLSAIHYAVKYYISVFFGWRGKLSGIVGFGHSPNYGCAILKIRLPRTNEYNLENESNSITGRFIIT